MKKKKEFTFAVRLTEDIYKELRQQENPAEFVREAIKRALFGLPEPSFFQNHPFLIAEKIAEIDINKIENYIEESSKMKEIIEKLFFWKKILKSAASFCQVAQGFQEVVLTGYEKHIKEIIEDLKKTDEKLILEVLDKITQTMNFLEGNILFENLFKLFTVLLFFIEEKLEVISKNKKLLHLACSIACMSQEYFKEYKPWKSVYNDHAEIYISAGVGPLYIKKNEQKLAAIYLEGIDFSLFFLASRLFPAEITTYSPQSGYTLSFSKDSIRIGKVEIYLDTPTLIGIKQIFADLFSYILLTKFLKVYRMPAF